MSPMSAFLLLVCSLQIYSGLRGRRPQKLLLVWKFTCANKNGNFVKETYFWLFCCMNNFCISHRLIYIPTHSFWVLSSMLISHFWLLPGLILFASLWHAGWIFKKHIYMNMNYSSLTTMYESMFTQMYICLVEKYFLQFWLKENSL